MTRSGKQWARACGTLVVVNVTLIVALSGLSLVGFGWHPSGAGAAATGPANAGELSSSGASIHGSAAGVPLVHVRAWDSSFLVSFEEEGLPNGSTWYVSFNGGGFVGNTITNGSGLIDFPAANGSYSFVVQPNMWYTITNASGSVLVNGTDLSVGVVFTALPTVPLFVRASGLALGTTWGISLGYPALVRSTNLTLLTFNVPNVSVPYLLTPPAGFGITKVTGPTFPTQTLVNITGRSTLHVLFGPLETVYFNETGLPAGAFWGLQVTTSLPHGGPPGQSANTTGSSINFTLVKGSWKFHLTAKPSTYLAHPGKGTVGVPAHTLTRLLRFTAIAENVVFLRTGLHAGTMWGVNITGPMNVTLSGATNALRVRLVNGTYNWTAWNFATLHPHAASGVDTVVAPSATHVIVIAYTALPLPTIFVPGPVAGAGAVQPLVAFVTRPS